jgi:hypothetical protein
VGTATTTAAQTGAAALAINSVKVVVGTAAMDIGGRMINSAKSSIQAERPSVKAVTGPIADDVASPAGAETNDMEVLENGVAPS